MADTDQRPPLDPPSTGRLASDTTRKGVFPLIWLLVLAALAAFGWSLYNRHAAHTAVAPPPAATPAPSAPPPKP